MHTRPQHPVQWHTRWVDSSGKWHFAFVNWIFSIRKPNPVQLFILIRTPILMVEKDNCGWRIGTMKKYFWLIDNSPIGPRKVGNDGTKNISGGLE